MCVGSITKFVGFLCWLRRAPLAITCSGLYAMISGVEVDEIAGPDVHRPHAKSHLSRVYAIETINRSSVFFRLVVS